MRQYLIKARKERGLTQQSVSEILGMSLRNYQRIERGELDGSVTQWLRLSDLFQCSIRKLYAEIEIDPFDVKRDWLFKLKELIDQALQETEMSCQNSTTK